MGYLKSCIAAFSAPPERKWSCHARGNGDTSMANRSAISSTDFNGPVTLPTLLYSNVYKLQTQQPHEVG